MRMGPDGRYVLFYPATETITEEEFRARYVSGVEVGVGVGVGMEWEWG